MTAREAILGRVRTALGRAPGPPAASVPPVRLTPGVSNEEDRLQLFISNLEKLAAKPYVAKSPQDAGAHVHSVINGRSYVASNSSLLRSCGIFETADSSQHRSACATVDFGVTTADYALADPGTLVTLSSPEESRLMSLLPPVHIALVPRDRILADLDELLTQIPLPAEQTSSMVLITGPSRTADIEQILVRGVHGPGELYVVIL